MTKGSIVFALALPLLAPAAHGAPAWEPKPEIPAPRGGVRFLYQSPVTSYGRIYVANFWIFSYDPAVQSWTTHRTPPPTPRYHHATAAVNGKLYVIGGSSRGEPRDWSAATEEFDPATESWRARAPMPGPRRNAGSAVVDGRIFVLGGEGAAPNAMPIVCYDPAIDAWIPKTAVSRIRHCWGTQAIGGKIYLLGNSDSEEPPAPLLEEYDPGTDTIRPRAMLPRPRMAFATAVIDGRLLVLGGSPGNNVPLAQVDFYDPATDTWSAGPDLPEPKCWLGAITHANKLYVLGGVAGDFSNAAKAMQAVDATTFVVNSPRQSALEPQVGTSLREFHSGPAVPVKFAEGAVTTDQGDWCTTFSPDGTEVYFLRPPETIMVSRLVDGTWSPATPVPFSGTFRDEWPSLSPDGRRLFFSSTRPAPRAERRDWDIWSVERTSSGWGEPQPLPATINTKASETSPSVSADGTLYFVRTGDIYRAVWCGDHYEPPEKLDAPINSPHPESDPRISPDGRELVFGRAEPEATANTDARPSEPKPDLYLSQLDSGAWSVPRKLPYRDAWRPCFSPDGQHLFFSSRSDIFQVEWAALGVGGVAPSCAGNQATGAAVSPRENVEPPRKPVPFASTINQSGAGGPVFTPDGRTVYLTVNRPAHDGFPDHWVIAASHFENGAWTVPQWLEFSGRHQEGSVVLSADGSRLYFWSYRSGGELESSPKNDTDIWYVEKRGVRWSTPERMAAPINSEARDYIGSFAPDGTLYFSSKRNGGLGEGDLYRARRIGDHFGPPENLGERVNSPGEDFGGTLSPDGQMLVFASDRPGGSGQWDLYVSALRDGEWQAPWNLGPAINSSALDLYPGFSPDGRRFFFTSNRSGKMEIFEVEAEILRRPPHIGEVLHRVEWLRAPQRPDSASMRIRGEPVIYVDPVALPDASTAIKADLIFITHPHPDHLDPATIAKLSKPTTRIVTVGDVARRLDSRSQSVTILAPGESTSVGTVTIAAVAAYNPSGVPHPQRAGWAGYVLTLDGVRLYFSGDTSFTPEMAALRDIDIAILNGHAPYQMSGAEMVEAVAAMKPRFVVPIHWGEADRADLDTLQHDAPTGSEVVLLDAK